MTTEKRLVVEALGAAVHARTSRSLAVLLHLPFAIIERADVAGLEPPIDTMEVERMLGVSRGHGWRAHIANAPCDGAFFVRGTGLVGLAVDAQVHDMVPA